MSIDKMALLKTCVETVSDSRLCLESPLHSSRDKSSFLEIYKSEVQRLFDAFHEFNGTLQQMRDLNTLYQRASHIQEMETAQNQFLANGTVQSKRLYAIKQTLDAIDESNGLLQRELLYGKGRVGTTELTIRVNVCQGLKDKLHNAAKDLNNVQYKFKCDTDSKEARFKRLGELAHVEDIDGPIDTGDVQYQDENCIVSIDCCDKFETGIQTEILVQKLKDTRKLEDNIVGLHQLFVELAAAVDDNANNIDDIEHRVVQTSDYHDMINEQLLKVRDNQIQGNKGATKWLVFFIAVDSAIILATIFA